MPAWFVLSAMRNGRSISKLTGRNISLSFWGRSFVISSSLTLTHHSGMQDASNSPAISMP